MADHSGHCESTGHRSSPSRKSRRVYLQERESEALDRNIEFGIMEKEPSLRPGGSEPCMCGLQTLKAATVQDVSDRESVETN
jgi:hypothetical protein